MLCAVMPTRIAVWPVDIDGGLQAMCLQIACHICQFRKSVQPVNKLGGIARKFRRNRDPPGCTDIRVRLTMSSTVKS